MDEVPAPRDQPLAVEMPRDVQPALPEANESDSASEDLLGNDGRESDEASLWISDASIDAIHARAADESSARREGDNDSEAMFEGQERPPSTANEMCIRAVVSFFVY